MDVAVIDACVANAASMKCCFSGAKLITPSWRFRSFIAASKSPAAACSEGRSIQANVGVEFIGVSWR
eukprot:31482-Pelagococcus_subviridis.AAC.10